MKFRVGFGFDVHQFVAGLRLILGGVQIPHSAGLSGHSDADAVIHAVMDALLGAAGLDDIGVHFPNTDSKYRDIDSRILLREVRGKIEKSGFEISNIDITVVAQAPKISTYTKQMKKNISGDLKINVDQVGIKATTTESLGFVGRKEGIAVWAVAALIG